jgi:hypothetical protein
MDPLLPAAGEPTSLMANSGRLAFPAAVQLWDHQACRSSAPITCKGRWPAVERRRLSTLAIKRACRPGWWWRRAAASGNPQTPEKATLSGFGGRGGGIHKPGWDAAELFSLRIWPDDRPGLHQAAPIRQSACSGGREH